MAPKTQTPYVIYNPAKVAKVHTLRKMVTIAATQAGLNEPVWIQTTEEQPGTLQATQAVADGADLVLAAGGDGTVRAVAAGLAGTGTPMAILPYGTGNLLSRNLHVPADNIQEAIDIAFFGLENEIDIAWMKVNGFEGEPEIPPEGTYITTQHKELLEQRGFNPPSEDEYAFIVIAGQGWDGRMMSETNSNLKSRVGWGAYVVAGAKALTAPRMGHS